MKSLKKGYALALLALALSMVPGVARADGWTAPSVNWETAAQSVVTSVGSMISTILPIGVTLLAIVVGVTYFLRFLKRSAKG